MYMVTPGLWSPIHDVLTMDTHTHKGEYMFNLHALLCTTSCTTPLPPVYRCFMYSYMYTPTHTQTTVMYLLVITTHM